MREREISSNFVCVRQIKVVPEIGTGGDLGCRESGARRRLYM